MLRRTTLALCLGLLVAAEIPATLRAAPRARGTATDSPTPVGPFRLGNAGGPFGWSTAVADFNADGRPDVVVADRAMSGVRGLGIRLDFAVSGQPARAQTFQAIDDTVTIRVDDVDHDQDLDIVLASPLSGRTVGVWLNDGAGHFTRANGSIPLDASFSPISVNGGGRDAALAAADLPAPRGGGFPSATARAPAVPDAPGAAILARAVSGYSDFLVSVSIPRGPPASSDPLIS